MLIEFGTMKTEASGSDPHTTDPNDQAVSRKRPSGQRLSLPSNVHSAPGSVQAAYSAWAAWNLAAKRAALLERHHGVDSSPAADARRRAARLREVLVAVLRTLPEAR